MHTVHLRGVPLGAWGPISLSVIGLILLLASVHFAGPVGPGKMHRGKKQDQAYKAQGNGIPGPQGDPP